MKYMIHTSPKRLWYVNDFMIPMLVDAGIDRNDIIVWNDEKGIGNLKSFVKSCAYIRDNLDVYDGVWHFEDDVVICKDFKKRSQNVPLNDIVHGFRCANWSGDNWKLVGKQPIDILLDGWQCVYIPNVYASKFATWFENDVINGKELPKKKDDPTFYCDKCFQVYMRKYHKYTFCHILEDSMVDHVDYLIGGSSVGVPNRKHCINRAVKFDNEEGIEELKKKLKDANKLNEIDDKGNQR